MQGLYFDFRKDKTLMQVTEQDGRLHQQTIGKEHISIVSERESRYLGRVSPRSGKAKDIASEILDLLSKKSVDTRVSSRDGKFPGKFGVLGFPVSRKICVGIPGNVHILYQISSLHRL